MHSYTPEAMLIQTYQRESLDVFETYAPAFSLRVKLWQGAASFSVHEPFSSSLHPLYAESVYNTENGVKALFSSLLEGNDKSGRETDRMRLSVSIDRQCYYRGENVILKTSVMNPTSKVGLFFLNVLRISCISLSPTFYVSTVADSVACCYSSSDVQSRSEGRRRTSSAIAARCERAHTYSARETASWFRFFLFPLILTSHSRAHIHSTAQTPHSSLSLVQFLHFCIAILLKPSSETIARHCLFTKTQWSAWWDSRWERAVSLACKVLQ